MKFWSILGGTIVLAMAGVCFAAPRWKPLTAGNYLVSTEVAVVEFTPQGKMVQSMMLPRPLGSSSIALVSDLACSTRGEIYALVTHRHNNDEQVSLWVASTDDTLGKYHTLPFEKGARPSHINLLPDGRIVAGGEKGTYLFALGDKEFLELPSSHAARVSAKRYFMLERNDRAAVSTVKIYAGANFAVEHKFQIEREVTAFAIDEGTEVLYAASHTAIRKFDWKGNLLRECPLPKNDLAAIQDLEVLPSGGVIALNRNGSILTVDQQLKPDGIRTFLTQATVPGMIAYVPEQEKR